MTVSTHSGVGDSTGNSGNNSGGDCSDTGDTVYLSKTNLCTSRVSKQFVCWLVA